LREKAAPKTINEEVGFLLRLLGERGNLIRHRLRKRKTLKLKGSKPSRESIRRKKSRCWSGVRTRHCHECALGRFLVCLDRPAVSIGKLQRLPSQSATSFARKRTFASIL
jgi:hypothetical protein